jgi:Zn-dependent peptidase ImmA (M78 family)
MQYFKIKTIEEQLAELFLDTELVTTEEVIRRTFKRPKLVTLLKSSLKPEVQRQINNYINSDVIVLKYEDEETVTYQNCTVKGEDTEEYYSSVQELIEKDYQNFALQEAEEPDIVEDWE